MEYKIIDKLYETNNATREELEFLLENLNDDSKKYLIEKSNLIRKFHTENIIMLYKENKSLWEILK